MMDGDLRDAVADFVPSLAGRKKGSSDIVFTNTWRSSPKEIEADIQYLYATLKI